MDFPLNFSLDVSRQYSDVLATCRIAAEHIKAGNTERAERLLDGALNARPNDLSLLLMTIRLKKDLGKYKEALDLAERARIAFPEDVTVYLHEALLQFRKGKVDLALNTLSKASDLAADGPVKDMVEGYRAFYAKNWSESVECFKAAQQDSSLSPYVNSPLGKALFRLKRYEEARAAILTALQDSPRSYANLSSLGAIEERLGNRREAIKAYEQALQINPASAWVAGRLVRFDVRALRWRSAWQRFRITVKANMKRPE